MRLIRTSSLVKSCLSTSRSQLARCGRALDTRSLDRGAELMPGLERLRLASRRTIHVMVHIATQYSHATTTASSIALSEVLAHQINVTTIATNTDPVRVVKNAKL